MRLRACAIALLFAVLPLSPAAASLLTSSARTEGARVSGSFWSPSRGPTSQRVRGI